MQTSTHSRSLSRRRATARVTLSSLFGLARSRQALARLDDTRLKDLGITPMEAETEASRPFWDIPSHWRK